MSFLLAVVLNVIVGCGAVAPNVNEMFLQGANDDKARKGGKKLASVGRDANLF